jgi:hypothetical protein
MADVPTQGLWPMPRRLEHLPGSVRIRRRAGDCCVVGDGAGYATQVIARRLSAPVVAAPLTGMFPVLLRVDASLEASLDLPAGSHPEAYTVVARADGITLMAASAEGLLRAAATLLQLLHDEEGATVCPCVRIADWPQFRRRCAADWLLNAEINRWGYDWGDGLEACRARMERKLDLCFAYKINQVWFDGIGWSTDRSPHYADLVRGLNRYARERGVSLVFAGYGGGYGTSYQNSELYRCGYHGEIFLNREWYPDGPEYLCCGLPGYAGARRYGTCLTNDALHELKLAEMMHFVQTVQPGAMYIHDIDAGYLSEAHKAWLMRCPQCRERFPSDRMADPQGQAGALAGWFRKVHRHLCGLPGEDGYVPFRDLQLIFTSPVYTHFREPGQPEVWQREVEYFRVLSDLIGPAPNVQFGIREQFVEPSGSPRIAQLAAALDRGENGHGAYVISFCGGDNFLNDDMVNASCVFAHLFAGARSVCLSNGGVHEEPLQLLNARALWCGAHSGFAQTPEDPAQADALYAQVVAGTFRDDALFGPDGALHAACLQLWGADAGEHLFRAYTCAPDGLRGPVSRVWWAITREVRRLRGELAEHGLTPEGLRERWRVRVEVTGTALGHAQAALQAREDPDIRWLCTCLDVGGRFARAVLLAMDARAGDGAARTALVHLLDELALHIEGLNIADRTDVLGGDPGCWLETVELLRQAALSD